MENWNPSLVFEIVRAAHQERIARSARAGQGLSDATRRRTPREALAGALLTLAFRLAPSTAAA